MNNMPLVTVINIKIDVSKLDWSTGVASHTVTTPVKICLDYSRSYELALSQVISSGLTKPHVLDIGTTLTSGGILDDCMFPCLQRVLLKKGNDNVRFENRDYFPVTPQEISVFSIFLKGNKSAKSSFDGKTLYLSLILRQCHTSVEQPGNSTGS